MNKLKEQDLREGVTKIYVLVRIKEVESGRIIWNEEHYWDEDAERDAVEGPVDFISRDV